MQAIVLTGQTYGVREKLMGEEPMPDELMGNKELLSTLIFFPGHNTADVHPGYSLCSST